MIDVMDRFPRFQIDVFTDENDLTEAYEEEFGESIDKNEAEGEFLCYTTESKDYCHTKSFILIKGYENNAEYNAIVAHECSHAVDDFLSRINEKTPGKEIRAYLIQASVMTVLEKLNGYAEERPSDEN